MLNGVGVTFKVGEAKVAASVDGGHPPEFWAERAVAKILGSSYDHLPPNAQEQARVFRARLLEAVLASINSAIRSDRQTVAVQLEKQGHKDIGQFIRTFRKIA